MSYVDRSLINFLYNYRALNISNPQKDEKKSPDVIKKMMKMW